MLASPIPRREFLCNAAAFAATVLGLRRATATSQTGLVARRVFFDNPDYGSVRLSPDGQHLAYLAPLEGVRNLWVAPLAEPNAARPITRATDRNLNSNFRWAYTNRHLIFFQERDGDENWRASSVDIGTAPSSR